MNSKELLLLVLVRLVRVECFIGLRHVMLNRTPLTNDSVFSVVSTTKLANLDEYDYSKDIFCRRCRPNQSMGSNERVRLELARAGKLLL